MNPAVRSLQLCSAVLTVLAGCSLDDGNQLTLAVSTEEPAPAIAETLSGPMAIDEVSIKIATLTDPAKVIEDIRQRKIDLAIIEEPNRPLRDITTLAPLYPSVLHILHKQTDTPLGFTDALRGASIYAGPVGGAAHRLLEDLAEDFSIGSSEYRLLDNPWTETPDVYFILGGLLSEDSVSQLSGYRLFNFASPGDVAGGSVADGLVLKHHRLRPFLLPNGVYHTLANEAVLTVSIRSVLVAHRDLDENLTYNIAQTLFNQSQEIALHYPLVVRELNESFQPGELMLPLHDGTRRYLDRDRPGFIERYVDIVAFLFTILITLLSGGFALYRYRQNVRKDRVDVFYSQLLDIRGTMKTATTKAECTDCYDLVLDVQHQVLRLLIDERITADTSFSAFISLSNQMLAELQRRST